MWIVDAWFPEVLGTHTSKLQNHGVTEWFELEETFEDHLVQPTPPRAGTSYQIAQSPVQPDLEQFQRWGIHNFSRQFVSPQNSVWGISKVVCREEPLVAETW